MVKKVHDKALASSGWIDIRRSVCLAIQVLGIMAVIAFFPAAVNAAQAVAVQLPAGNYIHIGEYFPLIVTLEESEKAVEAEVRVTLGDLTFTKQVHMSPGTSRNVLIRVLVRDEHPDVIIEVRSAGVKSNYPRLARTLGETLRPLPYREHLVCVICASHNRELSWLFERSGITTVLLKPRLEFPEEVLRVFDVVAFEDLLWDTLSQEVTGAIEKYVKAGGTVCISEHENIPFDAGLSLGLGKFYVFSSSARRQLRDPSKANKVKDKVISALDLSGHRRPRECKPSEVAEAFEPFPRYLGSRATWILYLTICSMTLVAAGLSGMLRLWSKKVSVVLMPVLSLGLSASFVFIMPAGKVAYERVSLVATASGSGTAKKWSYIQLYGFSGTGDERHELGVSGLVFPARRGYAGYTETRTEEAGSGYTSPVLHNGYNAAVSNLYLQGGTSAVFGVTHVLQLEGSFTVSKGESVDLRFTNNSGFDLRGSVLILSGTVTELGTIRFGQTLNLTTGNGEFIQDYLSRYFDNTTRTGRTAATFAQQCLKKLLKPDSMYVVGWTDGGDKPQRYAQVDVLSTMWIVQVKMGR